MDQTAAPKDALLARLSVSDVCSAPLAITFGTSVAVVGGASMLYPVLPVLGADLGVDETRIGLAMVALTAPAVILAPIFGVLADLRGRRWMLILGLLLFGLAGSAVALAPSYDWVLALRALQGVGLSAITPLTIVLIGDLLADEHQTDGQGFKVAIDRVAMIALPLVGGTLAVLSWRAAFIPFLLTVPLALAAYLWMPETCAPNADTLKQYLARTARAVRETRLAVAFGTGFLRFFLDYGLFTYLPVLVALRYGGSATTSGWLITASAVGSIATALTVSRIHVHQPAERLLAVAFLANAAALAIIALGLPLTMLAVASFLFGLGNGLISPLQKSLLTRRTPIALRGGVISVDRVIQQIAKSLAPALIGLVLLAAPLETVFWGLSGLSAFGMLVLAWVSLRPATS